MNGDTCAWCGERIKVQVFVGLGYCCEQHRKYMADRFVEVQS